MTLLPPENAALVQIVLWRNLPAAGSDYCALYRLPKGWLLKGTAIAALEVKDPVLVHYEVECDGSWCTRSVEVHCAHGTTYACLKLQADLGVWSRDSETLDELRGCRDIDIALTPATNTLPIRRLGLSPGASQEVTAAWIKIPDLTIQLLPQRYTKIDDHRYLYQSANNFSADLEVDDEGMVIRYGTFWERLAVYG